MGEALLCSVPQTRPILAEEVATWATWPRQELWLYEFTGSAEYAGKFSKVFDAERLVCA